MLLNFSGDQGEALLQTILDNSQEGLFTLDPDYLITIWNKTSEKTTNKKHEEVIGKSFLEVFPQLSDLFQKTKIAITQGHSFTTDTFKLQLSDIYFIPLSIKLVPFQLPDGKQAGVLGTINSVGLKKIDKNTVSLVETALDVANCSTLIIEADAEHNTHIVYCNAAFTKLTGYEPNEVLGNDFQLLFAKDTLQLALKQLRQGIAENKKRKVILRSYRKDGSMFYNEVSLSPFGEKTERKQKFVLAIIDLTEKIQTQRKLAESRANAKAILDNIIQAHVLIAPDLRILSYNKLAKFFSQKYLLKEMEVGSYYHEYFPPNTFEAVRLRIEKVLQGEKVSTVIHITNDKKTLEEKKIKWFELSYLPVVNELGDVFAINFSALDITEQKNYENSLKSSEKYYRLLFDANPHPMWIYDINTLEFLAVNNKALKQYEYTEEEFLTLTVLDIRPQEEVDAFLAYLAKNTNNESHLLPSIHITKSGKKMYVEIFSSSIEFEDRNARLVLASNVTEKRKAEIALEKSEKRLYDVLNSLSEGVWSADYPALDFNYISPAVEQVFGAPIECIASKPCWIKLVVEEDRHLAEEIDLSLLDNGESDSIYRINHPSGEIRWINDKRKLIKNEQGEIYRIEGIVIDVTKLQNAREELELRNKELQTFVYSLSHDLRGPMSSIMGLVNLCKIETNIQEVSTYMELIEERMNRMGLFTNDILNHSRNLNLPIEIKKIDFTKSIKEALKKLKYVPELYQSKMSLNVEPFEFYTDKFRLEEVFKIILANAFQYIDHGQDVFLVDVAIKQENGSAIITVADNGSGIDDEVKPRVFEMFYRGHLKSKGAGIGLYIAKQAIKSIEGEIEFESTIDVGSTFTIKIPNLKHF
ncbi:PAS domain S-box protein [Flammeovirgaceae bacterium SG7u.111]|nr:PAS domain S-box protein [Flammeovirgaceae bacterium SG7u.132]WPO34652.1 PAS domain S-box protein [Flammeovirgaceae bacterium SG7u.111]